MKLIFAILLVLTVVSSELSNFYNVCNTDICLMDTTSEGESEKEDTKNSDDHPKVKFKQNVNYVKLPEQNSTHSSSLTWSLLTSFMEIHSPPPDII